MAEIISTTEDFNKYDIVLPDYNANFVADLKVKVPQDNRAWNPQEKCWTVYGEKAHDMAIHLAKKYFPDAEVVFNEP